MTPTKQRFEGRYSWAELWLGDCQDVMPDIKGVDLTCVDPPYGVNLGNHAGAIEKRHGLLVKAGGYEDTPEHFSKVVVPAVKTALNISFRGMVFCVPPSMWQLPAPSAIGGIFVSGAVGRNCWGWSNMIHCLLYGAAPDLEDGARPTAIQNNASAEKTGHPTTKPLPWLLWAVSLGSREGELVLDPMCGSGTTGVACARLKRNFIGVEINPTYYAIACRRIQQELDSVLI